MNLAKRLMSVTIAAAMVSAMGLINVFASTRITTSSINEDDGKTGLTLSEVRSLAANAFNDKHYDVSKSDFDLDESESTESLSSSIETESGETYVLVCQDIETEEGYTTSVDELTYTYEVSDLTELTAHSITEDAGKDGLTFSEVRSLAADAFNDKHYDVSSSDFLQESGPALNDTINTREGYTYVFVSEDVDTESGYTTDVNQLTYIYIVSDSSELTVDSITENDGNTGLSLSDIQSLAADAYNDKHYDVSSSDFLQESGQGLSSSVTTKAGYTYIFVCDDIDTESGYNTDVDDLTYIYVVDADAVTVSDLSAGAPVEDTSKPITENGLPYMAAAVVLAIGMIVFKQRKTSK